MQVIDATLSEDCCETKCIHPEHVRPLLGRTPSAEGALRVGDLFGTLADPTRARILHALSLADELCVCDLALLLGLSVSGLSHQLRLLRDRDAVARRKVGRMVYYRLADGNVRRLLSDALVHPAKPLRSRSPAEVLA